MIQLFSQDLMWLEFAIFWLLFINTGVWIIVCCWEDGRLTKWEVSTNSEQHRWLYNDWSSHMPLMQFAVVAVSILWWWSLTSWVICKNNNDANRFICEFYRAWNGFRYSTAKPISFQISTSPPSLGSHVSIKAIFSEDPEGFTEALGTGVYF